MQTQLQTIIRKAQVSDIQSLVNFNQLMAKETEDKQLDSDILTLGVSNLVNDASKGFYLVAEIEGLVVGSLMVTTEWSDWRNGEIWWIQSVYVHPEQRNRGVFKSLYETVFKEANMCEDVVGIRLYVEDHNLSAQNVYQNLGMSQSGYQVMEFMKT